MIHCLHCGAETSNGLALCELCQRKAQLALDLFPVYFRNLARWRPGRAGSRPVPGSRVLYDGDERAPDNTGDRISDRLDEATTMLTTWARVLVEDRPHFPRPLTFTDAVLTGDLPHEVADALADDQAKVISTLCTAFEERLISIATLSWCGQFVQDLADHEAVLRRLTETLIPGWYAGACRHCGAATYVVPGLTWLTCGVCTTTTSAHAHLETILKEARGWVGRPKRLAEAIVALMDTEQSVPKLYTRIRQWAHQGELVPHHHSERAHVWSDERQGLVVADVPAGYARYRMGDVLDLVRRGGSSVATKAQAS